MRRDMESNSALEQALCRLYQSEEPPAGFEAGWRAAVRREESRMKLAERSTGPVSYTHLDVYKRQDMIMALICEVICS